MDIAYGTHTDWARKKIDMEEGEIEEEDSWEEMHSLRGSDTLGASKRGNEMVSTHGLYGGLAFMGEKISHRTSYLTAEKT